jgi:indolepyruvate ferredoxin oxidoreductase
MTINKVSLNDRFDLGKKIVIASGTQALVRLMLNQAKRDKKNGVNSAGLVTGYRGSPLGGVDATFTKAKKFLRESNITFQYGLNEDLAATALWGSQQTELRNEGKFDGVFGLWYGKGPGVDRCGDVFRHSNLAGTSKHGGVLVAMGDDHSAESSTELHQSEYALVDAMMPILSPAGVQDILDFGIKGWALSRYSGLWVGIKCLKDTIEVTEVVNASYDKVQIVDPLDKDHEDLNIRLGDTPPAREDRLHNKKLRAAKIFARANSLDIVHYSPSEKKIGIISAGKSWLDTVHALTLLGIDREEAENYKLTTLKLGMVWPIDDSFVREWAKGLDKILVVEEKRGLIEGQVKEALYGMKNSPDIIGKQDDNGQLLLPSNGVLDPIIVGKAIVDKLIGSSKSEKLEHLLNSLSIGARSEANTPAPDRIPYFCSGCPHNSSTKVPEGSIAYAGIGCHTMAIWMDRATDGPTHMGGEGINWIGQAPFSNRKHVFQNLGDGTYNHSGLLAIRAAVASNTNITYKILFNDAVAMTGGQSHEGDLSADEIIKELNAAGVKRVVGVFDEKEEFDLNHYQKLCEMVPRSELMRIQEELASTSGVTAIVYIQTCAAEKRRRRKKGLFPNPDRRIFINSEVCEGCGDCGLKSNCVSILPEETELGRKRKIDQSSCNKDFSCVNGFCPSFVSVIGAEIKKKATEQLKIPEIPDIMVPSIDKTYNIVVTGIGGTGVVTIGALLGMASHIEGKGAGVMEMAGLAQKGGAVHIHCRIAESPGDISVVRVASGEAHTLIGGDLLVTAGDKTLSLLRRDRSKVVCNEMEAITGDFTRNTEFTLPSDGMRLALNAKVGPDNVQYIDANGISSRYLGDTIFSNTVLLGMAYQSKLLPLKRESLLEAIKLNGAAVDGNLLAFELGRYYVYNPDFFQDTKVEEINRTDYTFEAILSYRSKRLEGYQSKKLSRKYESLCKKAKDLNESLGSAIARGYYKLMAYKDEYEVARLHSEYLEGQVKSNFSGYKQLRFNLAPPVFSKKDKNGHLIKREFGPWMFTLMKLLAKGKYLRGTWLDPFHFTKERSQERKLIREYEKDVEYILENYDETNHDACINLSLLPLQIRGFGHVKEEAITKSNKIRSNLRGIISGDSPNQKLSAAE